jgi:hypothetical protein
MDMHNSVALLGNIARELKTVTDCSRYITLLGLAEKHIARLNENFSTVYPDGYEFLQKEWKKNERKINRLAVK